MADGNDASSERDDEARKVHERLAIPLLVPTLVFLFAVLTIYGLSRIYLDLNQYNVGDVTMATPLAIGVSLIILLSAMYLASRPRPLWQLGMMGALAIVLLTGGTIWAAVHDEEQPEHAVNGQETPGPDGGADVLITLHDPDWAVDAEPTSFAAGPVGFSVENAGSLIHNFRVISTDLAQDALPLDDSGFEVDEAQVDVVAELGEITAGDIVPLMTELAAGPYVLICNIPTHYDAGMHTAFTVE